MKEELQKYGVIHVKRVNPEKFYEIICSYQGKENNPPFESYSCVFLDKNNIITFVSPNRIVLVEPYQDGGIRRYGTIILTFGDAFKILKPYLRKSKIKKIIYKSHE